MGDCSGYASRISYVDPIVCDAQLNIQSIEYHAYGVGRKGGNSVWISAYATYRIAVLAYYVLR